MPTGKVRVSHWSNRGPAIRKWGPGFRIVDDEPVAGDKTEGMKERNIMIATTHSPALSKLLRPLKPWDGCPRSPVGMTRATQVLCHFLAFLLHFSTQSLPLFALQVNPGKPEYAPGDPDPLSSGVTSGSEPTLIDCTQLDLSTCSRSPSTLNRLK